jgi:hypothetical protein
MRIEAERSLLFRQPSYGEGRGLDAEVAQLARSPLERVFHSLRPRPGLVNFLFA